MAVPAYVYVAVARYEDILKLGFSHDPCDRVRAFHERYFEYFDLELGLCLETAGEKDARRIELLLAHRLADHRARAPLVIETGAGGFTEWYRGAQPPLREAIAELVDAGYAEPQSLAQRFRDRLLVEREQLYERGIAMVDAIEALAGEPEAERLRARLRAMLDAYAALQIDVEEFLAPEVRAWLGR